MDRGPTAYVPRQRSDWFLLGASVSTFVDNRSETGEGARGTALQLLRFTLGTGEVVGPALDADRTVWAGDVKAGQEDLVDLPLKFQSPE